MSLDQVLARRRSVREFRDEPVGDEAIAKLLWAAQGPSDPEGHRTAPSAGATYPLELYAVTAHGVFHYDPRHERIARVDASDIRPALESAAGGQSAVGSAPLLVVFAAVQARTSAKYGKRAERYVSLEAGHAAQNVLLEATALGLGAVPVGAFDDDALARALPLPREQRPIYMVAVGHPRG
ncbi:MAG TPA: SagB/ThcOx family dehydrogenase [Myxococcota bacterium]|nr:SagB/ThcOx family dehydrogenase [Myxococcota bacterium]